MFENLEVWKVEKTLIRITGISVRFERIGIKQTIHNVEKRKTWKELKKNIFKSNELNGEKKELKEINKQ